MFSNLFLHLFSFSFNPLHVKLMPFRFYIRDVAGRNDKTVRPHDGEFLSSQYRHYRRQYNQLPLSQVNLVDLYFLIVKIIL